MITWKELSSKILIEVANLCDGHTVFKPSAFTDLGVPKELVDKYTTEHVSDTRDYKQTMFDDRGEVIPSVEGVYGLDVLEAINRDLGLPSSTTMGRGFRARQLINQIANHLGTL